MKDIPKSQLPEGAEVGDVLIFDEDNISIDHVGTKKLTKEIEDLSNKLF